MPHFICSLTSLLLNNKWYIIWYLQGGKRVMEIQEDRSKWYIDKKDDTGVEAFLARPLSTCMSVFLIDVPEDYWDHLEMTGSGTSSQEGRGKSEEPLEWAIRDTTHLHHLHILVVSEPVLQLDLNPITKPHYATLNQNTPTTSRHYSTARDSGKRGAF